mmetsp:Transcript_28153/g.100038  ORF Transcript_28153/g.100038 Transcript_28153/m.100038 type:complete len:300 (+) Transcript_28153:294-1193(+)
MVLQPSIELPALAVGALSALARAALRCCTSGFKRSASSASVSYQPRQPSCSASIRSSSSGLVASALAWSRESSFPPLLWASTGSRAASCLCKSRMAASWRGASSSNAVLRPRSALSAARRCSSCCFALPSAAASRRSAICSSAWSRSLAVRRHASSIFFASRTTQATLASRSSTDPRSYSACSSSARAWRSMSLALMLASLVRVARRSSARRFFCDQRPQLRCTARWNVAASLATSSASCDSAAAAAAAPKGAAPPTAAPAACVARGKTCTKKRLRPVSCCTLKEPQEAQSQDAERSSV